MQYLPGVPRGVLVMQKWWITVVIAVLVATTVAAQAIDRPGHIIVNSEDWTDVYSVLQFGQLQGIPTSFLVSDRHGPLLLNSIAKQTSIEIISSQNRPYFIGYESYAQGRGYSAIEVSYPSINLELARQLTTIKNFIIIDNAYGYNAISVAPYAIKSNSYVLFASAENIDDVVDFLTERQPEKILIYGSIDRQVTSGLSQFSPEIINFDGDRFANNVGILKKYQELTGGAKQVILSNGEFIEKEMMNGVEPVVFIGSTNVPDIIKDYIKQSGIQIGILIGNELVGTATTIRRQIGISVFVKFAQGARNPTDAISAVEGLDLFYLPTYNLNLQIQSMKLNRATKQLEVTLENTVEQAIYFKGTYTLTTADGARVVVGDALAEFIGGQETKTLVYDVEGLGEGDITGRAFVVYGESKNALEKAIDGTFKVDVIDIVDRCELTFGPTASFNPGRQVVTVTLENKGPVDCYAQVELQDLVVAGERQTFSIDTPVLIKVGGSRDVRVKTTLEKEDFESNSEIHVRAYYGERETSLVKFIDGKMQLLLASGDIWFYSLLVIIIALVIFIIWRRRQMKNEQQ